MASKSVASLFLNPILRSSRTITPSILRTLQPAVARRFVHAIPKPASRAPLGSSSSPSEPKPRKLLEPHYELTFTCVPCGGRSTHAISKQGYHKGSVLITCPSCRNRHVISDHLNIFGGRDITIEDLMREKGQLVKRGFLGEDGDVEFWEDGTVTERGAGANGSTSDSAEVRSELDALSEEEAATKLREARDPSSQSIEPTPATPTPLGNAGVRPSIGSVQNKDQVPSTRRQYSTESNRSDNRNPDSDDNKSRPSEDEAKEVVTETVYGNALENAIEEVMSEYVSLDSTKDIRGKVVKPPKAGKGTLLNRTYRRMPKENPNQEAPHFTIRYHVANARVRNIKTAKQQDAQPTVRRVVPGRYFNGIRYS